eukprot:3247297-Amphidinium_carterae.1
MLCVQHCSPVAALEEHCVSKPGSGACSEHFLILLLGPILNFSYVTVVERPFCVFEQHLLRGQQGIFHLEV